MKTSRVFLLILSCSLGLASLAGLLAFLSPAAQAAAQVTPASPQAADDLLQAAAEPWVFECADCPPMFAEGSDRALRLDEDGNPHLAYGRDHLYYARRDASGWHVEVADPASFVGMYTSLALDAAGEPRISYYDALHGVLKYAWREGGSWQVQVVDEDAGGGSTSLAIDSDGSAVISYWDSVSDTLKVAFQTGSSWSFEYPDPTSDLVGQRSSLAIDQLGNQHIAYASLSDSSVRYAYRSTGGWTLETAAAGGNYGEDLSIAVGGDHLPHISILDGWPDYDLKYVRRSLSAWEPVETVDQVQNVGAFNSIAVDGEENAHISYWADESLRHAVSSAAGWVTETVDADGSVGVFSSLALTGDGAARIAYYDTTQGLFGYRIKYAQQTDAGWQTEVVDTAGNVGQGASLALDPQGYPHLSYQDNTWHDLKYAFRDASGWHQETVDTAGEVGLFTSIGIDPSGYAHIAYYDASKQDLKYAVRTDSGWQISTVDSAGSLGSSLSLALDQDGSPHISYYAATPRDLRYARLDAGSWITQTVDSAGDVGQDNSLALDPDGNPHISYFDNTGDELRHAALTPSGWVTATVDPETAPGVGSSIDLGPNGSPAIAYYDPIGEDLRFAEWISDTWVLQTVDSAGDTGGHPSLKLDPSGNPHISYTGGLCPGPCGRLDYAVRSATGWVTETVDASNPNTGWYSSLALLGGEAQPASPRIGFFDALLGDLRLATTPVGLTGLDIFGPAVGEVNTTYAFTATVVPLTATLPVTYRWEASGQAPVLITGGTSQALTYTWTTTGSKLITVTAWNAVSEVSATQSILISAFPVEGLSASNDSPTLLGEPTTFTATWTGGSSPVIHWDFGDGHIGEGTPTSHIYEAAGVYTATVTATNPAGSASAATRVVILEELQPTAWVYLPVVLTSSSE